MAEGTATIHCPLASEIGWSDSDARLVWEGCFLKPKRACPKANWACQGGCWCTPNLGRVHTHGGLDLILEKITVSLSRRNLVVKLCCPFVLHSSRNIGESSSSTWTLTSIQPQPNPTAQRGPAVIISHLTASTDLPQAPSPTQRTINACRPARWTEIRCQLSMFLIADHLLTHTLTLVSGAPATRPVLLLFMVGLGRASQSER